MKRLKTEIEFIKWFKCSGKIDETNSSLQVLINKLHTKNNVVESITPPLEGVSIPYKKDILKSAPFKKPSEKDTNTVSVADIKKVFEHNNYTNQVLHIVSKHIEDSNYNYSVTSQTGNKLSSSKMVLI